MKKLISFILLITFCNFSFSQDGILDSKKIDELTKQDYYVLGQTYGDVTYKSGFGNIIAGFFFPFISKANASAQKYSVKKIEKFLKGQDLPKEIYTNRWFIRGFSLTRKQKVYGSMNQGAGIAVAVITVYSLSLSTNSNL